MAKPVLAAEANRIRRLGSSWAAMAKAADVQGIELAQAGADSELTAAAASMATAYSRAAAQAVRAAAAADAASAAEQAAEKATKALAKADTAVDVAEAAVVSANVTVATLRAAGAISILIGMNIGPSPAQFATLAHAEKRLIQAMNHRGAALWVLGNAEHVLKQSDQVRHRATRAFAAACLAEAEAARRALPTASKSREGPASIDVLADGLGALASVAAGQALAIDRFAQGDAGAAHGALEIVDRWAKRLARFGGAGDFAAPAINAAFEAFADGRMVPETAP
ncbi:MAG: hypothetical protein ABI808_12860 [Pseudonocardiales bacterium]